MPAPLTIETRNVRGVREAIVTLERPITIVVGPNGCGKSTILNQIRNQTFGRHIYVGPHRATRRQSARLRFMGGNLPAMGDLMSAQNLGGYEGVTISTGNRDAWELDEAANFFKYNLSKIEFQRNAAIAKKWDTDGAVPAASIPDVWGPLKELTANLMPHLEFNRVETDNYENMRCLFYVHGTDNEVDYDDLSSGEKSIIQTLYPAIERQIFKKLQEVIPSTTVPTKKELIIIDEPELHLHPSLQEKLVAYLRFLAVKEDLFVVLATHSPTIIDAADEDDILLLRPKESVSEGENQAVRLGDQSQRLIEVQTAIGSVFPATAARPILLIEGSQTVKVKQYSDKQLFTFMDSRFLRTNLMPGGGKDECLRILAGGRASLASNPFGLRIFALLDRDLEEEDSPSDGAFHLPVCMIENLLLDPAILQEGFGPLLHQSPLQDHDVAVRALEDAIAGARDAEIERRFRRKLRIQTFGPDKTIVSPQAARDYRDGFKGALDSQDYDALIVAATAEVDQIESTGKQRDLFSGKAIINAFYAANVESMSISKSMFVYQAAKAAQERETHRSFFDEFFGKILS